MLSRAFDLSKFSLAHMFVWLLMAFQAGAINVGAYIGCHRFVSHVTGFATLFGFEFARGHMIAALSMASVPLFFLTGIMFSAYFVDHRLATNKKPQYTFLICLIAFLMLVAACGGLSGWFGPFNSPLESEPNYPLLAILCLACGIQNASVTSASGAVIRTTHLSGITTDLGIGLMRLFSDGQKEEIRTSEKKATIMRLGIIGAFVLGSTFSAFLFLALGYVGYFLPAAISGLLVLLNWKEHHFKRGAL
jgi:uncharacterized membrane protein YoaK (UPF0700 family)